jgi:hypothetical protein
MANQREQLNAGDFGLLSMLHSTAPIIYGGVDVLCGTPENKKLRPRPDDLAASLGRNHDSVMVATKTMRLPLRILK